MKVWILTSEVNAYDQYGEYLVAVFQSKPTKKQVVDCGAPSTVLDNGGGRIDFEDEWFYLAERELPFNVETD